MGPHTFIINEPPHVYQRKKEGEKRPLACHTCTRLIGHTSTLYSVWKIWRGMGACVAIYTSAWWKHFTASDMPHPINWVHSFHIPHKYPLYTCTYSLCIVRRLKRVHSFNRVWHIWSREVLPICREVLPICTRIHYITGMGWVRIVGCLKL